MSNQNCPVDFDHHGAAADDWMAMFRTIRTECPVPWVDHYGGFWLLPIMKPCIIRHATSGCVAGSIAA
jgi:hypothetical protein